MSSSCPVVVWVGIVVGVGEGDVMGSDEALSPAETDTGIVRVRDAVGVGEGEEEVMGSDEVLSPAETDTGIVRVRDAIGVGEGEGEVMGSDEVLSPAETDTGIVRVRDAVGVGEAEGKRVFVRVSNSVETRALFAGASLAVPAMECLVLFEDDGSGSLGGTILHRCLVTSSGFLVELPQGAPQTKWPYLFRFISLVARF
jgi:hypothetical protein